MLWLLIGNKVLVYLDDVLTFAATIRELLETVEVVLRLLKNANQKCKATKCSIFTETINYLGLVVSNASIALKLTKLDQIRQWQLPTTNREFS